MLSRGRETVPMKFHGRPLNGLRQPTALETFVRHIVDAIEALGEAETNLKNANTTSTIVPASETALEDRVVCCEAELRCLLDRLTRLANERPVEFEKTRALLVHHKFRLYTDISALEVSKMRVNALCTVLSEEATIDPEVSNAGYIDVYRIMHEVIDARALVSRSNLSKSQGSICSRASRQVKNPNMRQLALAMMTPQARGHLLRGCFQEWRSSSRATQMACRTIWAHFRLCKQRLLSQAFGRWSRQLATYKGFMKNSTREMRRAYQRAQHTLRDQKRTAMKVRAPLPSPSLSQSPPSPPSRTFVMREEKSAVSSQHRHASAPGWDKSVKSKLLNSKGAIRSREEPHVVGRKLPWDRS